MIKRWTCLLFFLFSCFICEQIKAQYYDSEVISITVEEVSLIRIYPATEISMNLLSDVAGESMAPITNSATYLQLTSIAPANETRKVMASIANYTNIPSGTLLKLTLTSCTTGAGAFGSPTSTITLNKSSNQTIINNIGSGYTGTYSNYGFRLNYSWEVDPTNYASLQATSAASITITYTISTN